MTDATLAHEMTTVVRWLLRNPDTFAIVKSLAIMEEYVLPSAEQYTGAGVLQPCPHCQNETMCFPDGNELDWPSLDKHNCAALTASREFE